jgi:hypothetical protein
VLLDARPEMEQRTAPATVRLLDPPVQHRVDGHARIETRRDP